MFIVFEGNDKSGKTSAINQILKFLKTEKCNVFSTFEPGAGNSNDPYRKILLTRNNRSAAADLLYFLMSRQKNIKKIGAALKEQKIVISDRFYYSSAVYQGYISQHSQERYPQDKSQLLTMDSVLKFNQELFKDTVPDVVIFLVCKPSIILERLTSAKHVNYIDTLSANYHNLVYNGFFKLYKKLNKSSAASCPSYHFIETSSLSKEDVFSKVKSIFRTKLGIN